MNISLNIVLPKGNLDKNKNTGNSGNKYQGRGRFAGHSSRNGSNNNGAIPKQYPNPNNDSDESNRSNHNSRKKATFPMGFKALQAILEKDDIEQIALDLQSKLSAFKLLLTSDAVKPDTIVLVIKLLERTCVSSFRNTTIDIMRTVLTSKFMKNLTIYFGELVSQRPREKQFNKYFWDNPDEFWNNLILISHYVHDTIPSYGEEIRKMLIAIDINIPQIEEKQSIRVSDEIKVKIKSLVSVIEDMMNKHEEEKVTRKQNVGDEGEPPDDYRDIEIIPSAMEITVNHRGFLRKNIVQGSYTSVQHYLDVQFRLLREDFVAKLRKGICSYLADNKMKQEDLRFYKNVRILGPEVLNEDNCYLIQLDLGKQKRYARTYENSKRFMYGSLILLTSDNFRTVLFAKIAGRDAKYLDSGRLVLGFQDPIDVNPNISFLMVESKVYFEPYYQVLKVLKEMDHRNFPMERYIIKVEKECKPPNYLLGIDPVFYEIEETEFYPFAWPVDKNFYNLNEAQSKAFRAALTNEFVVIQGPPGTGKTFLGLKIVHTLLENEEIWHNRSPILIICYTNHALDQFLEGLIPKTDKLVRVGGQSKDENLTKFNLIKKRRFRDRAVYERRHEVQELMQTIQTLNKQLAQVQNRSGIIDFSYFEGLDNYNNSWFEDAPKESIRQWLLGGRTIRKPNRRPEPQLQVQANQGNVQVDEVDEVEEEEDNLKMDNLLDGVDSKKRKEALMLFDLNQIRNDIDTLQARWADINNRDMPDDLRYEARYAVETQLDTLYDELQYLEMRLNTPVPAYPEYIAKNPHNMTADDRWALYFFWVREYHKRTVKTLEKTARQYQDAVRIYNEMKDMEDVQMMKEQLVVGMTTTGAARMQQSLQSLRSPIVIVEEAAEVLEAHIVAALTKHCQHLILIGDHQQLKPSAATYQIETKFQLGISLFERMVLNQLQCHTLDVQHRMRPEISRLITPTIYPHLVDHETTKGRENIRGVDKNVFFLEHDKLEQLCSDESKKNEHEAAFVIALARHLVLNGYEQTDITILAAYLGQMFQMQRLRKLSENAPHLKNVRIAVLDNYQGEESKIILLSLVRSNPEGKPGFLKLENRVCVALSRARDGFYAIGNLKMLCESTEVWPKVRESLEQQQAVGEFLTLRCQVHPEKITSVRSAEDFDRISEGGCEELCNAGLGCGHICRRLCHVTDRAHVEYKCLEKCNKPLCADTTHICLKECYEECGLCTYEVLRTLECGHEASIPCHCDPYTHKCQVILKDVTLSCGHKVNKPCFEDVATCRCSHECDARIEPCGHKCNRNCHIRDDPDHIKYQCRSPCAKQRANCRDPENKDHRCPLPCYKECDPCVIKVKKRRSVCPHFYQLACMLDVDEIECHKPCKKQMECGHTCDKKCFEPCGPCKVLVEKEIPGCGHKTKVACGIEPSRWLCNGKCPRLLPQCGHECLKKCKEECTDLCTEIVDCQIASPCGHTVKRIECCYKNTADAEILLKACGEPCGTMLQCGHPCKGTCGKCHQGRVHTACKEKCGNRIVCGHYCDFPCRQACRPCNKPCEFRCQHSKCKKKCGEPCTPCREPCKRRCEHQQCKNKCGDICSVPPCTMPCSKRISCGHPCLGFCGDPCPQLCRICKPEEFDELLGMCATEDEENAQLVQLNDCPHIVVSEFMEKWLANDTNVQVKECFQCRKPICTTARFSDVIKKQLNAVMEVKRRSFGNAKDNETKLSELKQRLLKILAIRLKIPHVQFVEKLKPLLLRLQPTVDGRRQSINAMELNAIERKIQVLEYVLQMLNEHAGNLYERLKKESSLKQLQFILNVLMRSVDNTTDQEVEDLQGELRRLNRLVQFDIIEWAIARRALYQQGVSDKRNALVDSIRKIFNTVGKFTTEMSTEVGALLQGLKKEVGAVVLLSEKERLEVVREIGVRSGAWFRCPNGHLYAIGECGGAMEVGRCADCGAPIGGTGHRLLEGQQLALEMDGARAPSWPGY